MIITLPSSLRKSQKLLSYAERERERAQKDRPVSSRFACVCEREKRCVLCLVLPNGLQRNFCLMKLIKRRRFNWYIYTT